MATKFKAGDRVQHGIGENFLVGTVYEVNPDTDMAIVVWDAGFNSVMPATKLSRSLIKESKVHNEEEDE